MKSKNKKSHELCTRQQQQKEPKKIYTEEQKEKKNRVYVSINLCQCQVNAAA